MLLIALAVVTAAGVWWQAGGPVGSWLTIALRSAIGVGSYALPVVLLAIGVTLMRSEAKPEARPRLVIGALLFILAVLGV